MNDALASRVSALVIACAVALNTPRAHAAVVLATQEATQGAPAPRRDVPPVPQVKETQAEIASEWLSVWRALARLEALPREDEEHGRLRSDLIATAARRENAARKRSDRAMAFRARVLSAHLARLDGLSGRFVRDPGIRFEFLPGEAWLAARVTLAGPTRARAWTVALDEALPDEIAEREALAQEAVLDDLTAGRLELAEAVARALVARGEGNASVRLCARVLRANGRTEEAFALLTQSEPRGAASAERALFAAELARLALARGARDAAEDALGSALACGSAWARSELARRALAERDSTRALALTRPFLDDGPDGREARRVWALALLERSRVPSPGAIDVTLGPSSH